jgi:lipopolysaccharide transport system permease protein
MGTESKYNEILIKPKRDIKDFWFEIWNFKELFLLLAWRDVLIRYKQTVLGVLWSVLRPLLTMVVFSLIFGRIAKLPSDGVPYQILVYSALLPWQFFSTVVSESSSSIVANSALISKIYFPRIIIPTTSMIVSGVDFFISFAILICLMFGFGYYPTYRIFLIPLFIPISIFLSLGIGYLITALNVKFRDFQYVIPFLVQTLFYLSPVGFSSSIIPERWRFLYSLNPMVGVIDGFRWAILGGNYTIYLPGLLTSALISLFIFSFGVFFFLRMEKQFADVI